jgi:hypothetical protein
MQNQHFIGAIVITVALVLIAMFLWDVVAH